MPNGGHEDPKVDNGEVCAKCKVPFHGVHKRAVLCPMCHKEMVDKTGRDPGLPKAWLETEVT